MGGEPRKALDALEPAAPHLARSNFISSGAGTAGIYALIAAHATEDLAAVQRWLPLLEGTGSRRPFWEDSTDALRYVAAERALLAGDRASAIDGLVTLQQERRSRRVPNTVMTSLIGERLIDILRSTDDAGTRLIASQELSAVATFWQEAGASWYLGRLAERAKGWGLALPAAHSPADRRPTGLTRREREVALMVAKGLTNKEIAKSLTLSVRTAESHVERIRAKLGFHTRAQIASWATETKGSG